MNIRLSKELRKQLNVCAAQTDSTANSVVNQAIIKEVEAINKQLKNK